MSNNYRDKLLEDLNPLLADFIVKAKSGRINDNEKARVRISYANALANLIRAYSTLLRDKEYEELLEEVNALKEQMRSKEWAFKRLKKKLKN